MQTKNFVRFAETQTNYYQRVTTAKEYKEIMSQSLSATGYRLQSTYMKFNHSDALLLSILQVLIKCILKLKSKQKNWYKTNT